jgi:thiamine-monophosphate kinase
MTEFELISRLKPLLPRTPLVVHGAGDDCAVLSAPLPGNELLFKTDAVVEGFHFLADTEPERVGRKALARCLSDIAAMGGTPTAAVVTLGLPPGYDPNRVEGIYRGLRALAEAHDVAIVGGETTTNPDRLLISISLLGTVAAGRAVLRTGARPGDALFVTGELGGSIHGHHLDFEPRLREGRWLAGSGMIHSMIDVSDGLAGDLPHLLGSGAPGEPALGAELLKSAIPIRRAARLAARLSDTAKPPIVAALADGEDFELLFTVAPRDAVEILDGWRSAFPDVPLACIGKITDRPGIWLRGEDGMRPMIGKGYEHFR